MAEPAPEEGVNELHAAVLTGDAAAVTALLEAGADIESETKYGETTLMVAAKAGDATILDALIKAGATMDKQDKNGKSALMVRAVKDYISAK